MSTAVYSHGQYVAAWPQVSQVTDESIVYYERVEETRGLCGCAAGSQTRYERRTLNGVSPSPSAAVHDAGWSLTDGKSALMIVNPVAGGRGRAYATAHAAGNVLREAGVLLEMQSTTRRGDGSSIIRALPGDELRAIDVIVVVGGDGTLREVADGLVHELIARGVHAEDAPALAVVPAGSGNAAARSLALRETMGAALAIVHALRSGQAAHVALLRYARPACRPETCVGGAQWGMIADIDQGTEWLRALGKTRFDLGAAACIAAKRNVRARVRLTLHTERHAAMRAKIAAARSRKPRYEALDDASSPREVVIEDEFVTIVAWASPFISDDCMFLPFAKMGEADCFDVTLIRAGISRMEMLKVLTSLEDGSFVAKCDKVECFKVTRLEFESISGKYLTIDGEAEDVAPFVLDVAPESGIIRMPFYNQIPVTCKIGT